jgi:hypothetical protein
VPGSAGRGSTGCRVTYSMPLEAGGAYHNVQVSFWVQIRSLLWWSSQFCTAIVILCLVRHRSFLACTWACLVLCQRLAGECTDSKQKPRQAGGHLLPRDTSAVKVLSRV